MALLGEQPEPELLQSLVQQPPALGVTGPARLEPLVEQRAEPGVQRDDHRGRRGVVIRATGPAVERVLGDHAQVEVPALAPLDEPVDRALVDGERRQTRAARRGTSACRCTRCRRPNRRCRPGCRRATSRSRAAAARRPCRSPSGSTSLRTPVDVSACTTRDDLRRRVRVEQRSRIDRPAPLGSRPRTTSAPHRAATSHMRSPNTPLTPTTTTSPGSTTLTNAASMPAEPVPLIGSVSAFVGPEDLRAAARTSRRGWRGTSGSRWPSNGRRERFGDLGIRVARAGTHEDAVWMGHAASLCWTDAEPRSVPHRAPGGGERTRRVLERLVPDRRAVILERGDRPPPPPRHRAADHRGSDRPRRQRAPRRPRTFVNAWRNGDQAAAAAIAAAGRGRKPCSAPARPAASRTGAATPRRSQVRFCACTARPRANCRYASSPARTAGSSTKPSSAAEPDQLRENGRQSARFHPTFVAAIRGVTAGGRRGCRLRTRGTRRSRTTARWRRGCSSRRR